MAKSDCLFDDDSNKISTEAKLYGIDKDGKVKDYGDIISGGTAYPLSVGNGCLYTGNHSGITKMYIDEEKDELITEATDAPLEDEFLKTDAVAFFTAE